MKPWMKILMWLGLGGGIGFFAGYQSGRKGDRKLYEQGWNDGYGVGHHDGRIVQPDPDLFGEALNKLKEYAGRHAYEEPEDDPPMPEEEPVIGDEEEIEDIPVLHQQHLIPEQITEEEYYENKWGYDQESLIFYELDEVLFNKDTRKALKTKDEIDQAIGIGMTFCFYLKDGETLDAIFVRNDTMGTLFRIDRMEAAFEDEISGGNAPDYEEEEDDFTEEDLD